MTTNKRNVLLVVISRLCFIFPKFNCYTYHYFPRRAVYHHHVEEGKRHLRNKETQTTTTSSNTSQASLKTGSLLMITQTSIVPPPSSSSSTSTSDHTPYDRNYYYKKERHLPLLVRNHGEGKRPSNKPISTSPSTILPKTVPSSYTNSTNASTRTSSISSRTEENEVTHCDAAVKCKLKSTGEDCQGNIYRRGDKCGSVSVEITWKWRNMDKTKPLLVNDNSYVRYNKVVFEHDASPIPPDSTRLLIRNVNLNSCRDKNNVFTRLIGTFEGNSTICDTQLSGHMVIKTVEYPPTTSPTKNLSTSPSVLPLSSSNIPSSILSMVPSTSVLPSILPSSSPNSSPSYTPSMIPSTSVLPSLIPSSSPNSSPSYTPSMIPSTSVFPSTLPSSSPNTSPSYNPSMIPSASLLRTILPSSSPTTYPTINPSSTPSIENISTVPSFNSTLFSENNCSDILQGVFPKQNDDMEIRKGFVYDLEVYQNIKNESPSAIFEQVEQFFSVYVTAAILGCLDEDLAQASTSDGMKKIAFVRFIGSFDDVGGCYGETAADDATYCYVRSGYMEIMLLSSNSNDNRKVRTLSQTSEEIFVLETIVLIFQRGYFDNIDLDVQKVSLKQKGMTDQTISPSEGSTIIDTTVESPSSTHTLTIAMSIVGSVAMLGLIIATFVFYRRRSHSSNMSSSSQSSFSINDPILIPTPNLQNVSDNGRLEFEYISERGMIGTVRYEVDTSEGYEEFTS